MHLSMVYYKADDLLQERVSPMSEFETLIGLNPKPFLFNGINANKEEYSLLNIGRWSYIGPHSFYRGKDCAGIYANILCQ